MIDMTVKLEIDTSQQGLRMVLKEYEEQALRTFWDDPQKEYTSKLVWDRVNQRLKPGSISRASIINFLEDMVERREIKKIAKSLRICPLISYCFYSSLSQ